MVRARNGTLGKKLFSFVVYTDSHLNQSEHESMSPHEVNKLANSRHRYVISEINRLKPDFAIHLGDLVHPVPIMGIYADAAERFHEQVSELSCPLHIIPGNHDIGDKPIRWGPAETVSAQSVAKWEKHFGPHYHSFAHQGCRFVLLNAEIINSGLSCEAEQKDWLESELESARDERVFVGIHYPPFIHRRDEIEYYDNIAEPGRSWLLGLIENYGVEAVFSGHVHNFWFHLIGGTAFYILPSITFVRHDYSEMYRVPPGPEAGRNDAVKLGFMTVDVYEQGHLCNPIRSWGNRLSPDETPDSNVAKLPTIHPLLNEHANLGFDLRQPWAEIVEIPPNGGLDEFARKIVRNDYPLLALWEMGVRKLRVPFQDLLDARLRARMRDLRPLGMEFTVFSYKLVEGGLLEALEEHGDLVAGWELAVPPEELETTLERLGPVRDRLDIPIYISRLRSKEDMETDGQRYYHVINHGYTAGERDMVAELAGSNLFRKSADGFVFRIPRERPCWNEIVAIGAMAQELGVTASVHVRLATSNPAAEACEDLQNANRVAEALAASLTQPHIDVFLDTFADVDRGYFVRTGVVDRRYNPRLAHHVVRNLYAAFADSNGSLIPGRAVDTGQCSIRSFHDGQHDHHAIVLPREAIDTVPAAIDWDATSAGTGLRVTALGSGEVHQISGEIDPDGNLALDGLTMGEPFVVRYALKP